MGIWSWLKSHRYENVAERSDEEPSLVRTRYEDPEFEEIEKAAAADVAAVEEDDKYFGGDRPQ
jgi:hypothetical protein